MPQQKMFSSHPEKWRMQQSFVRNVQDVHLLEVYEALPATKLSILAPQR